MIDKKDSSIDFLKLNLGDYQPTKEETIEFRKIYSTICKEARNKSKSGNCFVCKQKTSGFCNSHFVPAFCLRNIDYDGKIYSFNSINNIPGLDEEIGINSAGTFHLICRSCDSKIFSEYENPSNYINIPTVKMLSQIVMKTYLKKISLRELEINFKETLLNHFGHRSLFPINHDTVNKLDLDFYKKEYNRAQDISIAPQEYDYKYFYYKKLPYVCPLAFQDSFALLSDLKGNIINNPYEMSPDYKNEEIHICVFPLEHDTIVMMFSDILNKKYTDFYNQFNCLNETDQLVLINYYIFKYSEHVFLSKFLDKKILESKEIKKIASDTNVAITKTLDAQLIIEAGNKFNLAEIYTIPNFFNKKFALR